MGTEKRTKKEKQYVYVCQGWDFFVFKSKINEEDTIKYKT